jgi:GTPase SAR1 family protein
MTDRCYCGTTGDNVLPTVCENSRCKVVVDDIKESIQLWDTAGQEEMESVRQLSYLHTDLLFFF